MGYLQKKDLDKIRKGAILFIRKHWHVNPDEMTMYVLVISIATLLYTTYYVQVDKHTVYASASVVSEKIPSYSKLAVLIIKARNLICHALYVEDCDTTCALLRSRWSEVEELLRYLDVLPMELASDTFNEYFAKVGIQKLEDQQAEYKRLSTLYGVTDVEELAWKIKMDLL